MANIKKVMGFDPYKVQTEVMVSLCENGSMRCGMGQFKDDESGVEYTGIVTHNGAVMFIMDSSMCWLDRQRVYEKRGDMSSTIAKLVKEICPYEPKFYCAPTGYTVDGGRVNGSKKKRTLVEYRLDNDDKIYFNQTFLSLFDDGVTLCSNSPIKPAGVYRGNNLIGIICPVNTRK